VQFARYILAITALCLNQWTSWKHIEDLFQSVRSNMTKSKSESLCRYGIIILGTTCISTRRLQLRRLQKYLVGYSPPMIVSHLLGPTAIPMDSRSWWSHRDTELGSEINALVPLKVPEEQLANLDTPKVRKRGRQKKISRIITLQTYSGPTSDWTSGFRKEFFDRSVVFVSAHTIQNTQTL
jgi:hypothetical protein